MKLKNKMLIILLIFFLLFLNSSVFASFNEEEIPDEIWSMIYDTNEYISGNYHLMFFKHYSNYVIYFIEKSAGLQCYYSYNNSRVTKYGVINELNRITFNKQIHLVVYKTNGTISISQTHDTNDTFFLLNPEDHSYSNISIYIDNTYTDFFFKPVTGVVIPALEQVEELPKAITTTLKIMIPVGLVVLGIGLIIYLIKRVIYSHL